MTTLKQMTDADLRETYRSMFSHIDAIEMAGGNAAEHFTMVGAIQDEMRGRHPMLSLSDLLF